MFDVLVVGGLLILLVTHGVTFAVLMNKLKAAEAAGLGVLQDHGASLNQLSSSLTAMAETVAGKLLTPGQAAVVDEAIEKARAALADALAARSAATGAEPVAVHAAQVAPFGVKLSDFKPDPPAPTA